MDPRHVLVADPLDPMPAKTELIQRRALQRFRRHDTHLRVHRSQIIAGSGVSGTSGCQTVTPEPQITMQPAEDFIDGFAGHMVMPNRVTKLFELVEDHAIRPRAANLPAP